MTGSSSPISVWHNRLMALKTSGLERRMRRVDTPVGPQIATEGEKRHLFSSNDYLGFANDGVLKEAMCQGVEQWGAGSGASRLVSGNLSIHTALEHAAADYIEAESAVLFVSGYQANVGALSSLVGRGDAIFSDALIHASLIDGARLSRADVHVYRHNDTTHLSKLLDDNRDYGIKLIVTDSIFSMDGDIPNLADIVELARRHNAAVYLDEAHALGVRGPSGRGIAAELGLEGDIDIRIATFSKALGVSGAFVAGAEPITAIIKSRARSLLYTTAPPPAIAAAALAGIDAARDADDRRRKLSENISLFRQLAREAGLPILNSSTAIQPVMTGDNHRTMAVSFALLQQGFFVQGIRPPTVPEGKGRLRVTLSALHEASAIHALVAAMARVLEQHPK